MGLLLESGFTEVICALIILFWIFYSNVTRKYSYWKDRGVPHVPPKFPFGCMKDVFMGKSQIGETYNEYYKQFKGQRYFGSFTLKQPDLVVRDPELIKHILTKDFNHFSDRLDVKILHKSDYINLHLFNMTGQDWKNMRAKLTPTFTSGKMKAMFHLMTKCGEQLNDYVDKMVSETPVLDVKDTLSRFTTDIIASCAFGLDLNSLSNKDCQFYRIGTQIFKPTALNAARDIVKALFPILFKILSMGSVDQEVSHFLTKIVRDTVDYREQNNVVRNDFLDLLIKIRHNKNLLDYDKKQDNHSEVEQKQVDNEEKLTVEVMTAQSFVFFAAGFETASSTMTFCLYELACNPEIQDRLYREILEVLDKHGGNITYQALQEMTYMDQVINETLRRYGSVPVLNRTCVQAYKVPDSDLILEKGQIISIPSHAIHHDPEYYPEPFKFDPERFSAEKVRERHHYVHLPFGEGPRMCIGMRFGLMQTKVGLTVMLSNYEFGMSPETQVPVTIHKRSIVTMPEKPILLALKKRKLLCADD